MKIEQKLLDKIRDLAEEIDERFRSKASSKHSVIIKQGFEVSCEQFGEGHLDPQYSIVHYGFIFLTVCPIHGINLSAFFQLTNATLEFSFRPDGSVRRVEGQQLGEIGLDPNWVISELNWALKRGR